MNASAALRSALAVLGALLAGLLLLSPARAAAPSVEATILAADLGPGMSIDTAETIAALGEDEVVVVGERDASRIDPQAVSQVHAAADDLGVPVRVVVASGYDDAAHGRALNLLSAADGRSAVFIVVDLDGGARAEAVGLDEISSGLSRASLRSYQREETEDLAWVAMVLEDLQEPESITYEDQAAAPRHLLAYNFYRHPVLTVVIGAVVLLGIAVAIVFGLGIVLRRRHRHRYRIPAQAIEAARQADRRRVQKVLDDDTLRIAERLESIDTTSLPADRADAVVYGLDAYAEANRIAGDPSAGRDDLAGALVLLRQAEQSAVRAKRRARRREQPGAGLRLGGARSTTLPLLCAVDPLHGDARQALELLPLRSLLPAGARVPGAETRLRVCSSCAQSLKADRSPPWLRVDGRPYVTTGSVWARSLYGSADADLVALLREGARGGS